MGGGKTLVGRGWSFGAEVGFSVALSIAATVLVLFALLRQNDRREILASVVA